MNSIKTKLMGSYLLVTVLTVTFLISFLLVYIQTSYMDNVRKILLERAESYSNFYNEYMSNEPLINSVERMQKTLPEEDVQIQFYDKDGYILSDSLNVISTKETKLSYDVEKALTGKIQICEYKNEKEELLALSYPLKNDNTVVGVIRLITSMEVYHQSIKKVIIDFIATGTGITLIVAIISYLLSVSITNPIENLTKEAAQMAGGKLKASIQINSKDEIGKLADTLNFMAEEINKREKLKNEFIASVSHDIRTPLTSIRGWVETLNADDNNLNAEFKEGLSIIENESIRLSNMVEDLLDFSKFSIGKIKLNITSIDLTSFLTNIVKYVEPRAVRQNITLKTDFPESSTIIEADEKRIKQVLFNLLDNSMKNTPMKGEIVIGYQVNDLVLDLFIKDSGYGIPKEELAQVTQKFYVGSNKNAGSGLGLSIVEEIVKLHQWKLEIESTQGIGTKVTMKVIL